MGGGETGGVGGGCNKAEEERPAGRFRLGQAGRSGRRGLRTWGAEQSGGTQAEEIVNLRGEAGVVEAGARLRKVDVEGRNHRFHAGVAFGGAERCGEATLDDLEGDLGGDGGAGGRAEEGGEGAVGRGDDFGAEGESAGVGFFEGLHADAGVDEAPVAGTGLGVEGAEGAQAGVPALQSLCHEEANEHAVAQAGAEERGEVVGTNRARQIGDAAGVVEKPGRPRGEGTKEEHAFAGEVAHIEVRTTESAGVGRRRAVDFGKMTGDDRRGFTYEPLPGDGKRGEAARHGQAGRLEQRVREQALPHAHSGVAPVITISSR